jgi:hypothetical protein
MTSPHIHTHRFKTYLVILLFTKTENRRAEQVLPWRLVPVGMERMWRGCRMVERMQEAEYGANIVYTCM